MVGRAAEGIGTPDYRVVASCQGQASGRQAGTGRGPDPLRHHPHYHLPAGLLASPMPHTPLPTGHSAPIPDELQPPLSLNRLSQPIQAGIAGHCKAQLNELPLEHKAARAGTQQGLAAARRAVCAVDQEVKG